MEYTPIQTRKGSVLLKIKGRIWNIVWLLLYRPTPWFMNKYRVLLLRSFGAKIHINANPNSSARIDYPWNLTMHAFSSIGENSRLVCGEKIEIGEYTCIGQDTRLIASSHDVNSLTFERIEKPIIIGKGVWVAINATILPGVVLNDYCVIGASSVVTKEIPEMMICAGNPCKPIKKRMMR
jgi:putative colanic acid biosynthesis acetyltransferase WcaF